MWSLNNDAKGWGSAFSGRNMGFDNDAKQWGEMKLRISESRDLFND